MRGGTISRIQLFLMDAGRHLSSLVINVKILAKHGSHRLATTEYRLLNTKEQLTNGRLLSAILVHGRSLLFGIIAHYSFSFLFLIVRFFLYFCLFPLSSLFNSSWSWNRAEQIFRGSYWNVLKLERAYFELEVSKIYYEISCFE